MSDEQPPLDFNVPAPIGDDERIAREEIGRYYDDRAVAARRAVDEAAAALAAAQQRSVEAKRLQEAWRQRGEIVSTFPDARPNGIEETALDIVFDAQHQHTAAMQAILRPAMQAPTTAAAMAALDRLNAQPDTAARKAAADELGDRHLALARWLISQGHDLGALAPELDEPKRTQRRRHTR